MENNVKKIHQLGQSIWLDFIDRKIMDTGVLQKLIDDDGVTGITSNPAIFEKAINNSSDYDDDIQSLSHESESNEAIFYGLAVKDIQRAADLFLPAYESAQGADGFVSLEVSPLLANNTAGTIEQAEKLWKAVDRENVMIKIPGTAEGLPAIRHCIAEGININITLLFGLNRYKEVTDAYISGLEDRISKNLPINRIASVASFFLSRIDVMIDPQLEEKGLAEFKGEVAIASAKMAYQIYKEVFNSERFKKLQTCGAQKQRLLWASTSSKNPSFKDTKYVEALIGPDTVDTIPLDTLEAFRDHGIAANTLESHSDQAQETLAKIAEAGISIDEITQKLEDEGVAKFNQPYNELLKTIERQKAARS